MNLTEPVALWALGSLPIIIALYVLRPKHRRIVVPSIRLWRQLPSDLEGRPRWRVPVSNLLLLAQLLIAAAVAIALAQPAFPGAIRQNLIVLLDTSPTMAATDVSPSRLIQASSQARELAHTLSNDDLVTLISVEPTPRILVSGHGPRALDSTLGTVVTAPERGDFTAALLLASQTAQLSRDTHNRIVILSDGTAGVTPLKGIGTVPADVSFQQVGVSDNNQGVTALTVRPMIGSSSRYVGFIQLANYAHQDATVVYRAEADGLVIDRQSLVIPARGHLELSLPLPVGTRHLVVAIDGHDVYRADDRVEVLVPDSQPVPVTLVAIDPGYWERAFKTIATVALSIVPPGAYKPDSAAITVFDQFVPTALPGGNVVLVQPARGNPFVEVTGDTADADLIHVDPESTLFDSVDVSGLYLPRVLTFGSTTWATSVVDSTKGPAILDGIQGGRRLLVIGFDPGSTDWPQRTSFPLFVANLVDSLVTAPIPTSVSAGAVLDLPPSAGANRILVSLPDGKIDVFGVGDRPVRFTDTSQLGRYAVTYANGPNPLVRQEFEVNRLGLSESNIVPSVDPSQYAQLGSPTGRPSEHAVWTWVAGGVLAFLAVEWLAYFSRLVV